MTGRILRLFHASEPCLKKMEPVIPFSVIIPSYNRKDRLRRCLAAVTVLDYPSYEVIVVDDGSTDGTAEMVRAEFSGVRCLRHETNRGCAAARNLGVYNAQNPLLAFTDDDCLAPPTWLRDHARHYADPQVGAVGGRQVPCAPSFYDKFSSVHYSVRPDHARVSAEGVRRIDQIEEWDSLWTNNLSVRADVFDQVGLFDEAFLRGSDSEFTRRINRKGGYVLIHDSRLRVEHTKQHSLLSFLRLRFHRGCGAVLADVKAGTLRLRRFLPVPNPYKLRQDWRSFRKKYGGTVWDRMRFWALAVLARWAEVAGRAYYYWKLGRSYRPQAISMPVTQESTPAKTAS